MNRKFYRYLLTTCVVAITLCNHVWGQETMRFNNKRLEAIVTALDDANARRDVDRLKKKVYVSRDNNGMVNAAGIQLFDKKVLNGMDAQNRIMCEFVERYLLELLVTRMPGPCMKLQEDRVKIFPGADNDERQRNLIVEALNKCDDNTGMNIETVKNNGKVTINNSQGKELLGLEFTMGYELMTGMTKIEAENALYDNLMYFCANNNNGNSTKVDDKALEKYKGNIMKTADNRLEDKDLFGMKYYRRNGKTLKPLYDNMYPVESAFTLMNGAYNENDVIAEVTVNMYGNRKKEFEIPVRFLTDFFKYNGCELYTGIKKVDEGMIEGAMVASNRIMNYNHIVEFEMSRSIFHNRKNRLKVTLYGYVPMHNVKLL